MVVTIEKASFIAAVGFSGATCALIMFKNAIEQFINGSPSSHARKKSIILITISVVLFFTSVVTIFTSNKLIKRFSKQITAVTTL